ncbi:MAG: c-type cytochrome [Candidatus Brachytrichaceae bacterium NZ_4S206]|jgi:mono/diheme cytochrome c family protein
MKPSIARIVILVASMAFALAGCAISSRPTLPVEVLLTPAAMPTVVADGETAPLQPPDAAAGAAIYEEKCAACHGNTGKGDGPSAAQIRAQGKVVASLVEPALARAAQPRDWHDVITNGRIQNLMPPFRGSLNAQQRWDVQAYLWALGTSPEAIQAGRQVYQAQCAACHGANGETPAGDAKRALNDPRFLAEHSLLDIANLMLRGDAHAGIALDETQRFQVADFVRTLSYRYADPAAIRLAATTGDGVINLRAINGTPNGQPIRNLPVTLRIYDTSGEVLSRTATLDEAGFVSFDNLPVRANYFYQAELDYSGGRFYAAPAQFPVTGTRLISDILPVFETTTDASAIRINELHIFVQDMNERTVTIVEYYLFDNASDRAYIGEVGPNDKRRTLRISAPQDAQNLRFDGLGLGSRFFQDGDVIYDSDVVVPGLRSAQIAMIYELPYRDRRAFERRLFYPVQRADVIVPEVTGPGTPFTVTGGLNDQGVQQTLGGNVRVFLSPRALAAGESFSFELRGRPLAAPPHGSDPRAIGFGLIAFGLAIGLAYFILNRARAYRIALEGAPQRRKILTRQIADLDDKFALGEIPEEDYRAQRDRLKRELVALWE